MAFYFLFNITHRIGHLLSPVSADCRGWISVESVCDASIFTSTTIEAASELEMFGKEFIVRYD